MKQLEHAGPVRSGEVTRTIHVPFGGEADAVDLISFYPFAQVREKLLMEGKVPAPDVDAAITEFRKYLTLIALGHQGLGMISKDVDEVWHTFILFTRDYADCCKEVFGSYLHHQPGVPSQPLGQEPRRRFLEAYHSTFGELPAVWGVAADTCWSTCTTPSTTCQDPKCR
jgi:hypothetical protein